MVRDIVQEDAFLVNPNQRRGFNAGVLVLEGLSQVPDFSTADATTQCLVLAEEIRSVVPELSPLQAFMAGAKAKRQSRISGFGD